MGTPGRMSTEPGNSSPPPPDPPNLSSGGKWGAPSTSPQMTRADGNVKYGFGLWWTLAILVVLVIIVVIVAVA